MTNAKALRKFELKDPNGTFLGRTLYINAGEDMPQSMDGEKWMEVAGFDEMAERAANSRLRAVLDSANQKGFAIVRSPG
jgi:hypothetical protein